MPVTPATLGLSLSAAVGAILATTMRNMPPTPLAQFAAGFSATWVGFAVGYGEGVFSRDTPWQ